MKLFLLLFHLLSTSQVGPQESYHLSYTRLAQEDNPFLLRSVLLEQQPLVLLLTIFPLCIHLRIFLLFLSVIHKTICFSLYAFSILSVSASTEPCVILLS